MLELIERTSPTKNWMKDYTFILIQSPEELEQILNRAIAHKRCAFDLESTGLDTRVFNGKCKSHVVGYSFSFEPKIGYYVPIRHEIETSKGKNVDPKIVNPLIQKLINECPLIGHNWLKYDIEILLASEGIDIRKYLPSEVYPHHDTYILARLCNMQPAGLKHLSKKYLNKEMLEITDIVPSKTEINFGAVSPFEGYIYAASDAICTNELFDRPEFQAPIKEQKFIYNLERRLTSVVRKLERNKIKLDKDFCLQLDHEMVHTITNIENSIFKEVAEKTNNQIQRFQLDSPEEVSDILFNIYDMNPKPEKGKKGNYCTDDAVLEKLAPNYPLASKLQEYRTTTKFHRTYIKNMLLNVDEEGYLKFNYSQLKTDSGRFASPGKSDEGKHSDGYSGVNVQSTPARYDTSKPNVRKCISCENDEVIAALDWSGVELRVACNMSKEPIWLDRFLNGDGDLHTATASIIYEKPESEITKIERSSGKCVDPESLLYINGRYTRIGELSDKRDIDTFYNLESDLNIQIYKTETTKIKQFYSNGPGDRLLVCSRRGLLVCSKNHRIELEDGSLVRAEDIKKEMVLKEPDLGLEAQQPIKEININPFLCEDRENLTFFAKATEELAYVLGLFLGDGGSSKNTCNIHTGGDGKYLDWQKTVKSSLEQIGLSPNINKNQKNIGGGMCGKVYFGSRHTVSIFKQLEVIGEDCKKSLKVPSYILNGKLKTKLSFLGGLLDTDGSVSKIGSVDMTTKSWVLAQDLCVLLASCNIHYSVEPTFNKTYKRYYYRIRIAKAHNGLLRPYIKCPWKLERMTEPKFIYKNYPKNTITGVIPLEMGALVDIGIEHESHIYLVNNIRTHNTFNFQSVYGGGPGALSAAIGTTLDDAREKQYKFFGKLQGLKAYIRKLQMTAEKQGYCLTQFGRKRMLPDFQSEIPKIRANGSRKATNTPIQGTSADLLKIAMIGIDNYLDSNNLNDRIKMVVTMHDELVFRIKKKDIDLVKEIEKIMLLENVLKKINWQVPLACDIEVGSSWDVEYEYKDMLTYLKDKHNVSKVSFIYESGQDTDQHIKNCEEYKEERKKTKNEQNKVKESKADKSIKEFKNQGTKLNEEKTEDTPIKKEILSETIFAEEIKPKKEELALSLEKVSSSGKSATSSEVDAAFSILKEVNLSNLPEEAYLKLRKSFYEKEIKRILQGVPATDDIDIETVIVVHQPIDEAKRNSLGFLIDSCPGKGKLKFVTQDKEELNEDWIQVDVLKISVMCKILNI